MEREKVTAQENADNLAAMIGAMGRIVAISIASLDEAGVINGRAIARSVRMDKQALPAVQILMTETADLIDRTIDAIERNGPASLKPV